MMTTTGNNTPQHAPADALLGLRTRKAEVKKQIKGSLSHIKATTSELFAPPPQATTKIGTLMNMMDQGIAIYDGIMLGMRVARNIRHIFGRKR